MNPLLVIEAIQATRTLIQFLQETRQSMQQSSEWTQEMEKAFIDAQIARASDPAWQPD